MLGGRIHPAGLPPSPSACPLGVLGVSTALAQPRPRVPAPCPVPGMGQPVVSPSGWVRRWEGWKRVPRGDFALALPRAELSQDLRWRLGHESGDLAVSPGQGRGAFTQRRPPGDYESCAASCQGREGPSSLLGSGSASTRCLFGFEELAAYPNVLLGAPSAPAWLPRASGWGSQCPAPLQPAPSSGRNYSLSFRSGWRGCLGCSWHRLLKASHPSGASREAGSILSTLIRPPRSGPGTVYWTGSEGFGFAAVSSAVDGCCF